MSEAKRAPRDRPILALIPNFFTVASLCAGMTAIRFALDERWGISVGLIAAAVVLDGLDGRSARLLKMTSKLGAQLDSLADFISFGVAPAMILYMWTLEDVRAVGWAIALLFATCMALRLARFNVQEEEGAKPLWMKDFFTGVPAPGAAGIALIPLLLSLGLDAEWPRFWLLNAGLMIFTALMMIGAFPTYSVKRIKVGPAAVAPMLIGCGVLIAFLAALPWLTMAAIGCAYLASMPFAYMKARRLRAAAAKGGTGED